MIATGRDFSLAAEWVQPLALVFHELMSNAQRHGALAGAKGTVEIAWSDDPDGLMIRWSEGDGEGVCKPRNGGAGFAMLYGVVERQLTGRVEENWHDEGLRMEISLPRRP